MGPGSVNDVNGEGEWNVSYAKARAQNITRQMGIISFLLCVLTRHEWVHLETIKWCRTCDCVCALGASKK